MGWGSGRVGHQSHLESKDVEREEILTIRYKLGTSPSPATCSSGDLMKLQEVQSAPLYPG